MKLLSIHIGKTVNVEFNGKKVETGIYKTQIDGPVKVSRLNIEGDQQADLTVHGGINKAIYAYPVEHYDYWTNSRPDLEFSPGVFGENLSVSGLLEGSVHIGDQFKIGEVVLQVTTPRLPCFKLGIKMGDPGFIKEFMLANRTGFYFKVIQEGYLDDGDPITQLKSNPFDLSVRDVVSLYSVEKSNKELLMKAVNSPGLPKDWIEHFEERLSSL